VVDKGSIASHRSLDFALKYRVKSRSRRFVDPQKSSQQLSDDSILRALDDVKKTAWIIYDQILNDEDMASSLTKKQRTAYDRLVTVRTFILLCERGPID
jgi:hypothetical protein